MTIVIESLDDSLFLPTLQREVRDNKARNVYFVDSHEEGLFHGLDPVGQVITVSESVTRGIITQIALLTTLLIILIAGCTHTTYSKVMKHALGAHYSTLGKFSVNSC